MCVGIRFGKLQLCMSGYQFLNVRVSDGFHFLLFPYLCFLIFLIHPSMSIGSLAEPFCECAWHWALAWGAERAVKTERPVFTEAWPRDRDGCVKLMTARRAYSEVSGRAPGQAHGAGRPGGPERQEGNASTCRSGGGGLGSWQDLTTSSQDHPTRHVEGERMAYMPIFLAMCGAAVEVRRNDSQMQTQDLPHSRGQEKCHYPFLCMTGLWDFWIKVQAGPSDVGWRSGYHLAQVGTQEIMTCKWKANL